MGAGTLAIITAFACVLAAPFFRHAFEMNKEQKFREMAGSIFWGTLPLGVASLVWAATGDASVHVQNSLLGCIGAVIGAAALIWIGYVVRPAAAQIPSPTLPSAQENKPMSPEKPGDINVNIHGDNNKTGDIGHKIIIQQEIAPTVELLDRKTEVMGDGLLTTYTVQLKKPVSRLFIQAQGPTVSAMTITRPVAPGTSGSTSKSDVRRVNAPGMFEESFSMAMGLYEVRMSTTDKQIPTIAAKIE